METSPTETYAAYPRATAGQIDTSVRLQSLSEGYFGLLYVVLFDIVAVFPGMALFLGSQGSELAVALPALAVVSSSVSYPFIKKICYGLSWTPIRIVFAAFVMGTSSLLCFGLLGALIYQSKAAEEIYRLGVKRRWFGGFTRADVAKRIEELRQPPRPLHSYVAKDDLEAQ